MTAFISFVKNNKRLSFILLLLCVLMFVLSFAGGSTEETDESKTLAEYQAELESRLSELCSSVEGVGKCRVFVTFESGEENLYKGGVLIETKPPRVMGVSVVCQGADKPAVKNELNELFTSLFDIGSNRVKILKLK